jgi:GTP-binding protein HflX
MLDEKKIEYEKTILIGVVTQDQNEEKSKEYLDELEFLAYTAGGEVRKRFTQKMASPNPKTFVGTGKMEEIQAYIEAHRITTAIFDDELSPGQ